MADDRVHWERKTELVLCCLGVTMGVGNLWRFPKAVYEGGGGCFLLAYLVSTVLLAKPVLCLEMCLGQFAGAGLLGAFQCFPLSRGLGGSICLQAAVAALLGNVVLAYTLLYLWYAISLPWARCDVAWGAHVDTCFTTADAERHCYEQEQSGDDVVHSGAPANESDRQACVNGTEMAAYQFFYVKILGVSGGLTEVQSIKTDILVSFFLVWAHVYAFTRRDIGTYRRLVYVSVLTPYAILVVILANSLSLRGAIEGLRYLFVPDWQRMADYDLWMEAAVQALMSLSLGHGAILVLSSFSDFSNPMPRAVLLVSVIDVVTCLVACAAVHAMVGHLAALLDVPVEDALPATWRLGMAFAAVPEVLVRMAKPRLWAFAFFLALYFLGLTASVLLTEVVLSSLSDQFNGLREMRTTCSLVFCIACFLIGLPICTHAGPYLFYLLEWFTSPTNTVLICTLELLIINFGYGVDRLVFDLTFMMKQRPSRFWVVTWKYVAWPVLLKTVSRYMGATAQLLCLQRLLVVPWRGLRLFHYTYPWPAVATSYLLVALIFAPVPLWAVLLIRRVDLRSALCPNPHWGPSEPEVFSAYLTALGKSSRHPSVRAESRSGLPPEAPLHIVGES